MAQHQLIDCHSPGYWGSDPHDRVDAEYVADKVLSGHLDKILAMGLPYALWRGASFMRDGLENCSCFKDTSKQPDIPCMTCYGTGVIPGYFKFGTRNYWASSTENSGWTLNGIVLDKINRPFRFMLDPAAITGTAISTNQAISVVGKLTHNPTTTLMFRVTMTRTSIGIKTPMFEIVRARFGTYTDIAGRVTTEPVIRVLPTWLNESEVREKYGDKLEARGNRFWTMPMAFFDSSLELNEPRSRISDDAFVEVRFGGENGYRYALVDFSYSDQFEKFTRQEFTCRKVTGQPGHTSGEFFYRIF
jgi:hypothetical protein